MKDLIANAVENVAGNSELIQNSNTVFFKLFPQLFIKNEAYNIMIEEIKNSDMSSERKVFELYSISDKIKRIKNQQKVMNIAVSNSKETVDFSEDSMVDKNWIRKYMDASGEISDESIQLIWGLILSKEFEIPNSTPLSVIRVLSELNSETANAFKTICNLECLVIEIEDDYSPLRASRVIIAPSDENELNRIGVSYSMLNELEFLGLIKNEQFGLYDTGIKSDKVLVSVNDRIIRVDKGNHATWFPKGNIVLSVVGNCIKRVIEKESVDFFEIVKEYYSSIQCNVKEIDDYRVIIDGDKYSLKKI